MLRGEIKEDLKRAMKEKDQDTVRSLRLLRYSIINREKEKRYQIAQKEKGLTEKELEEKSKLSNEEVVDVLCSEAKKRKESIEEFQKAEREDLAQKEKAELEVIESYLPPQLSEQEIKENAAEVIKKTEAQTLNDVGRVMGALMVRLRGRADGGVVMRIVKEMLSDND